MGKSSGDKIGFFAFFYALIAFSAASASVRGPEVYPAVDAGAGAARPVVMDYDEAGSLPIETETKVNGEAIVITSPSPSERKAQNRSTATQEKFDPVPAEQVGLIVKRLRIVERLLREHGRAYDYRSHTLRELEEILNRLQASAPHGTPDKHATQAAGEAG
jgi:hypothetical protein